MVCRGDELQQLFSGLWQQVIRDAKDLGNPREGQRVIVRLPLPGRTVAGTVGELESFTTGCELELGSQAIDRRAENFSGAMEEPEMGGSPVLFVFIGCKTGNGLQLAIRE